jgi:nitrogen fixation NifU-like protein
MDLKSLYRDVILDHYKSPRNSKLLWDEAAELDESNRSARCKNPSCGDRIRLQVDMTDGRVSGVGYSGVGCAISQASASMMTMALKGRPLEDVQRIRSEFRRMIVDGAEDLDSALLGDLITLQGVAKLHARVKCAMCGWSALEAALDRAAEEIDLTHDSSMPESSAET